jgi:hypothetical protein
MLSRRFFTRFTTAGALLISLSVGALGYAGCTGPESLNCNSGGTICPPDAGAGGTGGESSSSSSSSSSGDTTSSSSSSSSGVMPCNPAVTTCGCGPDGMCSIGLMCIDGLCVTGCNTSFECGAGKVCVNGKCEIGCSAQNPCDAGYACYKGFCIPDPTKPTCTGANPCPMGQTCVGGVCKESCMVNAECPMGEVCDSTTGGCITNPSPVPSCGPAVPCPGNGMCGSGGYCQFGCADVNACKLIDNRFVACDQGICKTPEELNPACSLDKPCPAGQDCVSNKCL